MLVQQEQLVTSLLAPFIVIDDCRGFINDKLKSIAYSLNNCFDINKLDEITDDNAINEINYALS